ncbi:MAG: hypothetical protein J3Q66DRAFT_401834 [Benniella sp.]|nr:MAG: hypothetical protein J3Q66DRAFT_401834 [Benniella sp.]
MTTQTMLKNTEQFQNVVVPSPVKIAGAIAEHLSWTIYDTAARHCHQLLKHHQRMWNVLLRDA